MFYVAELCGFAGCGWLLLVCYCWFVDVLVTYDVTWLVFALGVRVWLLLFYWFTCLIVLLIVLLVAR